MATFSQFQLRAVALHLNRAAFFWPALNPSEHLAESIKMSRQKHEIGYTCRKNSLVKWFSQQNRASTWPAKEGNKTSRRRLIEKAARWDRLCYRLGTDLSVRHVTSCASLKCVWLACSHMRRCVSTPWRSARLTGIQHPGSGKTPACRVRRQLAAQIPGLRSPSTDSP